MESFAFVPYLLLYAEYQLMVSESPLKRDYEYEEIKEAKSYIKRLTWSDENNCFIGTCPGLFEGGVHGDNEA